MARMLYHSTSVSCNPGQIFGLTTANQLALALLMANIMDCNIADGFIH